MASFLHAGDRELLLRRLDALTADSKPQWGRFTVPEMLFHLRESARMASGSLPVPDHGKKLFQMFPLKHLILYVLPFPKGAPTAKQLLPTTQPEFDRALKELREALYEFQEARSGTPPTHPLFGPLTRAQWGTLVYKHTDHHLRQFGV